MLEEFTSRNMTHRQKGKKALFPPDTLPCFLVLEQKHKMIYRVAASTLYVWIFVKCAKHLLHSK